MFALIESGHAPRIAHDWTSRMASALLHGAAIAAAVFATQRGMTSAPTLDPPVNLIWQAAPTTASHPATAASATSVTTPAPVIRPFIAPVTISPEIPLPGAAPMLSATFVDPAPGPVVSTVPAGLPLSSSAPLDARIVDEPPVMLSHPAISYPEVLRQAGIEGRVMVEAVLDTLGRVEPASPRVSVSPNPLFDHEALAVVQASRYRPGRVDGRAVRVRIQVPVTFSIRR